MTRAASGQVGRVHDELRDEVSGLLQRLVACDTSNPPGRETQAAAIIEDHVRGTGLEVERVAKDPDRANLVVRLRGTGDGPSLAFLGHLDVVPARREDWSVEPFAAVERDGAIWGRGTVDMKCQVAAATVALAVLAREGFRPAGDLMLLLVADEEVGDSGVGAPFLVEERPDLAPDFVIGEGSGERYDTPAGPLYLLDHGVKGSSTVKLTVRGKAGDSSLPDSGPNALFTLARLLTQLQEHRSPVQIPEEVVPVIDAVAPGAAPAVDRLDAARAVHPALDRILGALTGTSIQPTAAVSDGPLNSVPEEAEVVLNCIVVPGTTEDDLERELREAFGEGDYSLEVGEVKGGSTSALGTPLHDAIAGSLAELDPDARLIPGMAYGFSDCHVMREGYGSCAYGFIPFRHGDPSVNLATKHGADERILVEDLVFQTRFALAVARAFGSG